MKKNLKNLVLVFAMMFCSAIATNAQDAFIGEIKMVGFNFSPRNWAECNGQLLPINQYTALFSLLGTTYGGDGRTTFALPDLRGRIPVGMGRGPGLKEVKQGATNGLEKVAEKASEEQTAVGVTVQPIIGMKYVICLNGIFPSRS